MGVLLFIFIFVGAVYGFLSSGKIKQLQKEILKLQDGLSFLKAQNNNQLEKSETTTAKQPQKIKQVETDPAQSLKNVALENVALENSTLKKTSADDKKTEQAKEEKFSNWAAISKKPKKSKPSKGSAATQSLEDKIGSLWAVWVGGLALAFGGVFLVKFSIDNGLLSPFVRIILGLAFSLSMIAAGEWTRRKGNSFSFANYEKANIPAILTSVGTMGAFATIYAAYLLYDMLPDMAAFFLLGIVATLTTIAALLHGPLLAVLGILASYLMPFLISSDEPNVLGLGLYIIAVSFSGFAVGRLRLWRWLAIISASGLIAYGFILSLIAHNSMTQEVDRLISSGYVMVAFGMIAYVFVISLYKRSSPELIKIDNIANILLLGLIALMLINVLDYSEGVISALLLISMIVAPFVLAHYYSPIRIVIYGAMIFCSLGYLGWSLPMSGVNAMSLGGSEFEFLRDFKVEDKLSIFSWVGVAISLIAAGIGLNGALFSASRVALAIGGAFTPLVIFAIAYARLEGFSISYSFSILAFVLFAILFAISEFTYKRLEGRDSCRDGVTATYIIAAFVALVFALGIIFERGVLTVSLALVPLIIAIVYQRRKLPALRPLAVVAAGLWVARILYDPSIVGDDVGSTPIFNWLLYGYGIPTLAFALSAWLLSKDMRDVFVEILEAIALASFVLTLALVGLHALSPNEIFSPIDSLAEAAMLIIIGGGVSLGLLRIKHTTKSSALAGGASILGMLGMIGAAIGLLFIFNPIFTNDKFGNNLIFNELLIAYLAVGVLYITLGLQGKSKRMPIYNNSALTLGSILLAAWVNLTIRHGFHPRSLNYGETTDLEIYSYSIIWLIIGVVILAGGMIYNKSILRKISIGILFLVVVKVFLFDMAGLEGIWRAASFIGLGIILIGIGLVYQRVLSNYKNDEAEEGSGVDAVVEKQTNSEVDSKPKPKPKPKP